MGTVLSECYQGSPRQCHKFDFVPGYNLIGEGYDIVKLKTTNTYVIDVESYLHPTNSCTLVKNSFFKNAWQKLPISVVDWRSFDSCDFGFQSFRFPSVTSLLQSLSRYFQNDWKVGLNVPKAKSLHYVGTKSQIHEFATSFASGGKSSFASHSFACSYYSFRLTSKPPLSHTFFQDIRSLPKYYCKSTREQYRHFIDIYGTHYIRLVRLGGMVMRVTGIQHCVAELSKVSISQMEDCFKMELPRSLDQGFQLEPMSEQCSNVFAKYNHVKSDSKDSKININFDFKDGKGWKGDTITDSEAFKKWRRSLKTFPAIISFDIHPLHKLVPYRVISNNLRKAIEEYLTENKKKIEEPVCKVRSPNLSPDCCPLQSKRGRLTVVIHRGYGLHGRVGRPSDAYVTVRHGGQHRRTHMIQSYDPFWNTYYDFGIVNTDINLVVEAFDQDWFRDIRHGTCDINIVQGQHGYWCPMSHEGIAISLTYTLTCDHYLTDLKCNRYSSSPT
ncbi:perforin-1-like [Chanos chanos]|uniref:Perforin-1-like n=1 Tax=Chanos chanos TaxID=29144 RepID=A0A6J2UU49_CHACN|nr:perforin-1-like [Chanos chanos]